jgi:nucleoside-diphosphate-sugar epimerase
LTDVLVNDGFDVLALDRKPPHNGTANWKYADLTDRDAVMRYLDGAHAVVHLGEIPNMFGPYSPDEIFALNTRTGSTVFQSAAYLGVKKIVYASTAQIYGCWGEDRVSPLYLPLDENHPAQPQNTYALSKVANESYLRMLSGQHPEIAITILRFPAVIGYWPSWQFFVERMRHHTDDRDGYGTYVHSEDICEAFRLSVEKSEGGQFRVYNVMADDIASLSSVHEYVAAHWPSLSLPAGFPDERSWASAEKIKAELGWQPKHSVHKAWSEMQNTD